MRGQKRFLNLDENAVNVFTDGSSLATPRRGGIGIRIVTVDAEGKEVVHDEELLGWESGTNQEMELLACIEALRLIGRRHSPVDLDRFNKVVVYTDSMYVANNYEKAKFFWPRTAWQTRDGKAIEGWVNRDDMGLMQQIGVIPAPNRS